MKGWHRFGRYGVVGGVATVCHYLVLALAVEAAAWPAWIGSGLGAVVGAQVAWLGNRRFTFARPEAGIAAWWRYQLTAATGALAGMAIVGAAVALGAHYLAAQVLATLMVMGLTYEINRRWTFG